MTKNTRKRFCLALALCMLLTLVPLSAFANTEAETASEPHLRVTLQALADFHGMMNSEMSVADPGFARFATYMEASAADIYEATGHAPVVLHAGDAFFGQSINNLMWGEPTLRMMNHLGVRYGAVGNHEFSWQNRLLTQSFSETDAAARAALLDDVDRAPNPIWEVLPEGHTLNRVEPGIQLLAADIVYEGTTNHPDWVEPYAILDDWYADYGVKIAVIGMSHPNMPSLVGPLDRAGLEFRSPRVSGDDELHFEWLEDMITMLREDYGVAAVVALTHFSSGDAYTNAVVDRLMQRGNAHLDGFFSGHTHGTFNEVREYNGLRTAVVLGPHHGRGYGQIELDFNASGVLVDVHGSMGGAANGNPVRLMDPDPEVFEWVHGVGATWTRNADIPYNIDIDRSAVGENRANWGWEQVRDYWWGRPVGPRITYATGSQHHRNQFLVNLLHDYVTRVHGGDLAYTTGEPFDGVVIINNQSSWRAQDAASLTWGPDDQVDTAQLMAALTFENTMPLFEIRGRDLIEMLNMPGHTQAAPGTPPEWGRWPADPLHPDMPDWAVPGQPNWGTMQGSTVTGAFYQNGVWHLSATLAPISPDGVYRLGASNHLYGGFGANGGQHWPLPGNNHGNALGFEVIDFTDGHTAFGAAYYRGPRYAIRDPETDMHISIQETWLRQTAWRAEQVEAGEDLASWIELTAAGNGSAALSVWGFGVREFPGASTHSGWGNPAYGADDNTTRDLVLNGSVVRATATAADGYAFLGWFDGYDFVSASTNFIFNAEEDLTLTARFVPFPFTDVPADVWDWARPYIAFVYVREVMQGDGDGRFNPGGTFTRAMVAVTLWNAEGRPEVDWSPVFTDIPENAPDWYRTAVMWAYENNVMQGHGDGRFGPTEPITREQFAATLARYADFEVPENFVLNFPDTDDVSPWAVDYMRWANYHDLIRGTGGGLLLPGGFTDRAQAATILARFIMAFVD